MNELDAGDVGQRWRRRTGKEEREGEGRDGTRASHVTCLNSADRRQDVETLNVTRNIDWITNITPHN
jgi:hypothetical protein